MALEIKKRNKEMRYIHVELPTPSVPSLQNTYIKSYLRILQPKQKKNHILPVKLTNWKRNLEELKKKYSFIIHHYLM